jgi:anti-anti-sigma factor
LAAGLQFAVLVTSLVIVDLDGVRFLSSAGLRAPFEANRFAIRECCDLLLVCHSQTANWALKATGLREHFTFI